MRNNRVYGPAKYFPTTNPTGVTNPPLAVWQFDAPETYLTDRTANGRDLAVVAGAFEFIVDEVMGLTGIWFGSGDHELIAPNQEALRVAQDELGGDDASLTIEAIVRPTGNNGTILGCSAGGESLATNYLWSLGEEWDDGGVKKYSSFLEYGTGGANASVSSTAVVRLNTLMYLAMTISADGLTFKWYRDGVLIGTGTATHRAEKNSAGGNVQRVRIGRRDDDNYDFRGLICGIRITNETFADADVAEVMDDQIGGYSQQIHGPELAARFEESIEFPPAGGDPKQESPVVPGATRGKIISLPPAGFEEQRAFQPMTSQLGRGPVGEEHGVFSDPLGVTRKHSVGFAEDIVIDQNVLPEFNTTSLDSEGNNHFIGAYPTPYRAFFYQTEGEPWANPTLTGFTGYARNGKRYTGGVEDVGPVWAPWASEASGADRSSKAAFPQKSLIVIAQQELCIFDLDSFDGSVSSLNLWMRFRYGDSSNFNMIGRGDYTLREAKMRNGALVIAQRQTSWEDGRLIVIDFKGDDTYNTGNMIGSSNHWRWNGTIAQRNTGGLYTTSGVSPSLRQNNERIYSVSPWFDDDGSMWVAYAGEDDNGVVRFPVSGRPDWVLSVTGDDVGDVNLNDEKYRNTMFDRLGILWFSIGDKLFRNTGAFREGAIVADLYRNRKPTDIHKGVQLPGPIEMLAEAQNFIFAACSGRVPGIYAVNRGSLNYHLAYTPAGGGGIGTREIPGIGELFVDEGYPRTKGMRSFSVALANFIAICTELPGGMGKAEATLIRTTDDYAPVSFQYPDLAEGRPLFHEITL